MNRLFLAVATLGLIGLGWSSVSIAEEPKPDLTKVKEQVRLVLDDLEKEIERIEDPYRKFSTVCEFASARDFVGNRAAAVKALAKAAGLRKKFALPVQQFHADVDLAGRYLEIGDRDSYHECEQRARQGMHGKDQDGDNFAKAIDLLNLAHYEGKANDRGAARETLARALELSQSRALPLIYAVNLIQIASVYREIGDREDAGAAIDKGLDDLEATELGFAVGLDEYVEALVLMDLLDDALRIIALPKCAPYRLELIGKAAGAFDTSLELKRPDFLDRLVELLKQDNMDKAVAKDAYAAMIRNSREMTAAGAVATAKARVGRVEDALRAVMPGLEKKDASSISIAALREIALAQHRSGDQADARRLLKSAFGILKPVGTATEFAALSKAQIEVGEVQDAGETVAAIVFYGKPDEGDERTKLPHKLGSRSEVFTKAMALAVLARALAESGEKEQARKRIQESLELLDSHQTRPFDEFELREPLQELIIARSRIESMTAGLEMLSRIKERAWRRSMQIYIIQTCSRVNDLKDIETILDGIGGDREFAIWIAVGREVARGDAETVAGWARRLRDPGSRLWAVLNLTETLRLLADPGPSITRFHTGLVF